MVLDLRVLVNFGRLGISFGPRLFLKHVSLPNIYKTFFTCSFRLIIIFLTKGVKLNLAFIDKPQV